MPPRISRLQWPRLFPRHEPLLFLYPRWFAVEAAQIAPISGTEQTTVSERQHKLEEPAALSQTQQEATAQSHGNRKDAPSEEEEEEPWLSNRARWPSVAKRKEAVQRKEEKKRKQLREKAFWAQDWNTPLALLRFGTPSNPRHHAKQLERLAMPEGMRGYYEGDLKELFLEVYLHTGCHVQLSRDSDLEDGSFLALDMAGTGSALQLAKAMLNKVIHVKSGGNLNAKGKMGDYNLEGKPVVDDLRIRAVWNPPRPQHASTIEIPPVWTVVSFANYVHALVTSELPELHETKQKDKKNPRAFTSHVNDITNKLSFLFQNEQARRHVSAHAATQALQFMLHHRHLPLARNILEKLEKRSSGRDTTFLTPHLLNTCMRAAAEASDLHTYNFLLRMMTDRSIAPNHETWASLARLVQKQTPRNTRHVITAMRAKNVWLSPGSRIAVANTLIAHDFHEWIKRGDTAASFFGHYDALWEGPEWMDHYSANIMIETLLSRGEFNEAYMVLDTLISRNRSPNLVTLHTFLGAAVLHKYPPLAVFALKTILGGFPRVRPNASTYDRLAKLAFEKRAYNTLRVIWRYACMSGHVSGPFKHKMQDSLLKPLPSTTTSQESEDIGTELEAKPQLSRPALFKSLAAKTAIGLTKTFNTKHFEHQPEAPTPDAADLITPQEAQRREKEIKEQRLTELKYDTEVARIFVPERRLEDVFEEAVERDARWALEGMGKCRDLGVLLEKVMEVKVEKA